MRKNMQIQLQGERRREVVIPVLAMRSRPGQELPTVPELT
jgi:hypothetical protein